MPASYTIDAPAVKTQAKTAPAATALVSKLERKHPYWVENNEFWTMYDLLYRGGSAIQAAASRFLRKRPKEVNEVYLARLAAFTHQPILGPALGWYQSALFRKDPSIDIRTKGQVDPTKLDDDRKKPYTDFLTNCDRNRTTYVDLWRQVNINLMLYKGAYVCIDLPSADEDYGNRKRQKQAGALDPYLVSYDPRQIINWEVDTFGVLKWIVIRVHTTQRDFLGEGENVDRWYYYDREEYRIYERRTRFDTETIVTLYGANGSVVDSGSNSSAKLVDYGPHAMAGLGRVPSHYITLPEGLHLANRAYLPSVAHINIQNSYYWALFMANLPVPVITTDEEVTPTISETSLIHLPKDGKFEWSEPAGTSFDHSAKCLSELREEIYRSIYLLAQGRSSSAVASAASGYSKELDMMPSKDVLAGMGDIIRPEMQNILADVALVREDPEIEFDVRGFNFEISPALQELETLEIMMSVDIPSDTLYKQAQKRVANAYLTDANRAIQQTVNDEIDKAPTRSEAEAAAQQAMKLSMSRKLNQSVRGLSSQAQSQA